MEEKILNILNNIRPDIEFENEKALIDDELLESFDVIQIVSDLMAEFDIFIDADDIEPENFNSFDIMCEFVQSKLAQK